MTTQPASDAMFPPGHPDAPPRIEQAPPGMVWALAPNGERVLAYLPPETEQTAAPAVPEQRDNWPPRLLAGGAATSAVLAVTGHYATELNQAGHAVQMAGIGVGVACASVGALVMLVKNGTGRKAGQGVNVSVNVTATGGTAHASSTIRGKRR